MKSEICLIRHGITEGNKTKVFYGAADIHLIDEGKDELADLREEGIYPQYESAEFYTSGMIRTEETLEIIYGEQPHTNIPLLKEYNFGVFEMKHYKELKELEEFQAFIDDKEGDVAPPEGECTNDFLQRVEDGFQELKVSHYEHVLKVRNQEKMAASIAVIHGGVIAAIMNSIWPDQEDWFYKWTPDPGHGYRLILEDGGIVGYEKF